MNCRKLIMWSSLVIFVITAILVKTGQTAAIDQFIYQNVALHINPTLTPIMIAVSWLGDTEFIVTAIIVLLLIPGKLRMVGMTAAVGGGISSLLNGILKNIFARMRPGIMPLVIETSYSFPSGHSMSNMAIYTVLSLLLLDQYDQGKVRRLPMLFYLFVLAVGFSRIYLGVHYFSDVIGGYACGIFVAQAIYPWIRKVQKQLERSSPH